jgi:hypothetical protein
MAVSLVDQVIDQMLFGDFNTNMIDLYGQIPCMPGWDPVLGGWKVIPSGKVGFDVRAWDWTVPGWLLDAELDLRHQLLVGDLDVWSELAHWRYSCLYSDPRLMLSNGALFRQRVSGFVKSGAVNTIASNTNMRLLLHNYVSLAVGDPLWAYFIAMGDDAYQDPPSQDYVDYHSSIVELKEPVLEEFCSHYFHGGHVEPLNWGKHLTNMLYSKDEHLEQVVASMQLNHTRSVRLPRVREIAYALDPSFVRSPQYLLGIYDGEMAQ